jgi:hypothetical protein
MDVSLNDWGAATIMLTVCLQGKKRCIYLSRPEHELLTPGTGKLIVVFPHVRDFALHHSPAAAGFLLYQLDLPGEDVEAPDPA